MSEHSLVATAGVAAAEAVDDIKAVTHHELSLRQRHDGWEATVVSTLMERSHSQDVFPTFFGSTFFRMIAEGRSNARSILDDFVVLHPDVELLNLGDPKIFQTLCRLFES